MKSYTTEDFEFEIDGVRHTLPELNVDLFEAIADLYKIDDPIAQMKAWREAILDAAEADETKQAIRKLGIRKTAALFKDWTGIGSGEGSSSTD